MVDLKDSIAVSARMYEEGRKDGVVEFANKMNDEIHLLYNKGALTEFDVALLTEVIETLKKELRGNCV